MASTKFELLTSPSFAKIHILSILFWAAQRDPRKFPASTAVPVLAFPSSYLKVPISVARKAGIITLILHMPWDLDDLIGCIFIFRKHLSSMKNLCVMKGIIWKLPLPMASVSRLAWEPSLHVNSPGENHFPSVKLLVYSRWKLIHHRQK